MDEHPEGSPGGGGRGHSWDDPGSVLILVPQQRPGSASNHTLVYLIKCNSSFVLVNVLSLCPCRRTWC